MPKNSELIWLYVALIAVVWFITSLVATIQ